MASPFTFPFQRFPPELLLDIARRLPDLASLHALASAAPAVFRLLDRYGGELLHAITSNPSATVPQVRDLIRVVVLARTSALPAWTIDDFARTFLQPTMAAKARPKEPCVPPVPSELPYSVLVTAKRVHGWAQACLLHHLQRLRDAQPRLRRPVDPGFNYTHGYGPDDAMVPGWQRQCEGVPYETPAMGPASWVEEQVVVRAFWRLQLFLDLQSAAKEGRLGAWPAADVHQLSSMKLEELFIQTNPLEAQYQELLTVTEYLQDQTGHLSGQGLPAIAELKPHETSEAVPEMHRPDNPRTFVHQDDYLPRGLKLRPSIDLFFSSVLMSEQSPVRGLPAQIFRRLGLTIWDRSRLASLGLEEGLVPRGGAVGRGAFVKHFSAFWFQWRSLLRQDELSSAEERLAREAEEEKRLADARHARWLETGSWD